VLRSASLAPLAGERHLTKPYTVALAACAAAPPHHHGIPEGAHQIVALFDNSVVFIAVVGAQLLNESPDCARR
jgi:hypothetical protein